MIVVLYLKPSRRWQWAHSSVWICERWSFAAATFIRWRFRSCTICGGINTPLNEQSSCLWEVWMWFDFDSQCWSCALQKSHVLMNWKIDTLEELCKVRRKRTFSIYFELFWKKGCSNHAMRDKIWTGRIMVALGFLLSSIFFFFFPKKQDASSFS